MANSYIFQVVKSNEITVPQTPSQPTFLDKLFIKYNRRFIRNDSKALQCHCPIYKTNEQYSRKQALYRTTFKNQLKHFTKRKDLMARLVTAEAGGESYKGKVAVAKVILNRKCKRFSKYNNRRYL